MADKLCAAYISKLTQDLQSTLFLENKAQIKKKQTNNYRTMFFMSKQISLPKISLFLQKIKIGPKCYIA